MTNSKPSDSGSIFGGSLMIAGCCIGAGMLGLPVITAKAGYGPSLIMFFCSWIFMTITGLLILEVNLWFVNEVSFVSMAHRTLGRVGKWLSWIIFLFLFYSLMVAYVAGTGSLFTDIFKQYVNVELPVWVGSLTFVLLFGFLVFLGTQTVDNFNRFLMLGLIVSYVMLVAKGSSHIKPNLLLHYNWGAAAFILPVMIVSFGFHNLVPSLTNYMKGDVKKLKKTIIIGSSIPLVIYIVWEGLILGIIPLNGETGFDQALSNGDMATQILTKAVGSSFISRFAEFFAFFAIVTSILPVSLSFVDFLADGLKIKKNPSGKLALCSMVLIPPFLFALFNPQVFLTALNYAGGFGAVTLFGILPAAMVWKGRYQLKLNHQQIVPGGKSTLCLVIGIALAIFILQFVQEIGKL